MRKNKKVKKRRKLFCSAIAVIVLNVIAFYAFSFFGGESKVHAEYPNSVEQKNVVAGEKMVAEMQDHGKIKEKMGLLNIPFIENGGQVKDSSVKYYADIFSGRFLVSEQNLTYALYKNEKITNIDEESSDGASKESNQKPQNSKEEFSEKKRRPDGLEKQEEMKMTVYNMQEFFVDGYGNPINLSEIRAENPATASISDFRGSETEAWQSELKTFNQICLGELWPNINVTVKAHGNNVEKIFTVNPGGDPNSITMRVEGADTIEINKVSKELIFNTALGDVSLTEPVAYQYSEAGEKRLVSVAYRMLDKKTYSFSLGDYDQTQPVIIDPLVASTFLGGSDGERGLAIEYDPTTSSIFVTGEVYSSPDFPTSPGAYDVAYNGGLRDVFISKFDEDLTTLLASTYLGGTNDDIPLGLFVDSVGKVFVTGSTNSANFPTILGSYDTSYNDIAPGYDIFISKLNNNLTTLEASTYLGTMDTEHADGGIRVDSSGNVFIGGYTNSANFPTTVGAYDRTHNGGQDLFISKLNNTLSSLVASTYIGSPGTEGFWDSSIDLDASQSVYILSGSDSALYPTTAGAYDTSHNGQGDAVISKLNNSLSILEASTFLGGPDNEYEQGGDKTIDFDSSGNIFVLCSVEGSGFPTVPGSFDTAYNGGRDIALSKLDPDLTSLLASTYLGGSGDEYNYSLAIDSNDNVFVAGYSESSDFPKTVGAYDDIFDDVSWANPTISKLDGNLSNLLASTYFKGSDYDNLWALELDGNGNPIVTGETQSSDFPISDGAFDDSLSDYDSYLSIMSSDLAAHAMDHLEVSKPNESSEGFESTTFPPGAEWSSGGNASWVRTTAESNSGSASAVSGTIANSQSSWIDLDHTFQYSGEISFFWKVSSEDGYDFLFFCIDNDTCTSSSGYENRIDGETDWVKVSHQVSAGSHSFRWTYSKDGSTSNGTDQGWIDDVVILESQDSVDISAGDTNTIRIAAVDETGGTYNYYTGNHDITLSGPESDGSNVPTCTDKDDNPIEFGSPINLTFVDGVAHCDMVLYKSETTSVDADDGTYDSTGDPAYDLDVLVTGGVSSVVLSPANSQLSASPNPADIGNLVTITLTAYDESGNPYTTGGDTVVLSVTGANTESPAVTDNGNGTYTASYTAANSGEDLITGTMNGTAIGADTDGVSDGTFHESITASTCVVDATKTTIAVAPNPVEKGNPATVTVTTFDSGGSVCTVGSTLTIAVSGPETLTLDPTNNGNGTYTSTFTPQVSGTYTVTATLGGQAASTDLEVTEASASTVCGNKSSIDLASSKNKRLKFDICILAGDEASSKDISKKKDQSTGLKKLSLEAISSHGIEGQLKVATVANPQDILSRPSKLEKSKTKKAKKLKKLKVRKNSQLFKQSYLSGNYLTYKALKLSPSFSQEHLEKGQLFLRVAKDWIQKNRIKEIQFIRSDNREEEMLKSQEDDSSSSDIIYKVTTTSQLSKYISIVGLPDSYIRPTEPSSEPDEPTSEPDVPEIIETPSEPAAPQGTLRQPTEENELKASEDSLEPRSVLMEFMDMLKRALFAHPLIRNAAAAYAIAAAGLALPLLPFLFELNSVSDIWLIFKESTFRLFGILFSKKKKRGWGIVYDKVTGQPVPLATVNIYDDQGKRRESKVTDSHGIYFFLVTPGKFVLEAIKRGYRTFIPDSNREINVFYEADYKGGILNITDPDLVNLDIPLELQSANPFRLFFRKKFVESALWIIFWVGLATNILISIYFPSTINYIITALYIILAVARNLCLKSFQWGQVFDSAGKPVVFSEVRILNPGDQRTVARTLTDELGRYLIILKEGSYILEVRSRENALLHHSEFSIEEMGAVDARIEVG